MTYNELSLQSLLLLHSLLRIVKLINIIIVININNLYSDKNKKKYDINYYHNFYYMK